MATILNNIQFYCIAVVDNNTGDITHVVTKSNNKYSLETTMYQALITRLKKPLEEVISTLGCPNGKHFEIRPISIS